jgi:nitrogen fixation-related uncharacterized protein
MTAWQAAACICLLPRAGEAAAAALLLLLWSCSRGQYYDTHFTFTTVHCVFPGAHFHVLTHMRLATG